MKRNKVLNEVVVSCEELKCLEAHFRQMRNIALVHTLKRAPTITGHLLEKLLSQFKSADQLKSTNAEPKHQ